MDLLLKWSGSLNLSSKASSDEAGFRAHIDDSLSIVANLPAGLNRLIDLGSGQGFPAIPIAIQTGIAVDLIEADRRKAAFLTTTLATLGIEGRVSASRIEDTALSPAGCVTARALAPLPRLLELATRFLSPSGCCLFLKGPHASGEITAARLVRDFDYEIIPTATVRSCLVRITRLV